MSKIGNNLISNLPGHVLGHNQLSMSGCSLGMDDSLWDALTGEMGELVEEMEVLEEDWAVWSDSQRVLVVVEGGTGGGRDELLVGCIYHLIFFLLMFSRGSDFN